MVPTNTTVQNKKNSKKLIHLPFPSVTVNDGLIIQLEQAANIKFTFSITQEYLRKVVGLYRKSGQY